MQPHYSLLRAALCGLKIVLNEMTNEVTKLAQLGGWQQECHKRLRQGKQHEDRECEGDRGRAGRRDDVGLERSCGGLRA